LDRKNIPEISDRKKLRYLIEKIHEISDSTVQLVLSKTTTSILPCQNINSYLIGFANSIPFLDLVHPLMETLNNGSVAIMVFSHSSL